MVLIGCLGISSKTQESFYSALVIFTAMNELCIETLSERWAYSLRDELV